MKKDLGYREMEPTPPPKKTWKDHWNDFVSAVTFYKNAHKSKWMPLVRLFKVLLAPLYIVPGLPIIFLILIPLELTLGTLLAYLFTGNSNAFMLPCTKETDNCIYQNKNTCYSSHHTKVAVWWTRFNYWKE